MHFFLLDMMRGVLAAIVVISHAIESPLMNNTFVRLHIHQWWMQPYQRLFNGIGAVDIFFALTGFLMCMVYPRVPNFYDFFVRRIIRLYPLYCSIIVGYGVNIWLQINDPWQKLLVVIVVGICTYGVGYYAQKQRWVYMWPLIYAVSIALAIIVWVSRMWYPHLWTSMQMQGIYRFIAQLSMLQWMLKANQYIAVLWSLQVEMLFYLAYGLVLWRILQKVQWNKSIQVLLFWLCAHACIAVFGLYFRELNSYRWGAFFAGMVWAHMLQTVSNIRIRIFRPVGIICFALSIVLYLTRSTVNPFDTDVWVRPWHMVALWHFAVTVLYDTVILFLLAFATYVPAHIRSWHISKKLLYLGGISYSLYLVHMMILDALAEQKTFAPFILLLGVLGYGVSHLFFVLHEKPYALWKSLLPQNPKEEQKPMHMWDARGRIISYICVCAVVIVFIGVDYMFRVNWRLHVSRPRDVQIVSGPQDTSVLRSGQKIRLRFTTAYDNFGSIFLPMTIEDSKNASGAKLMVKLYDAHGRLLESSAQGIVGYKKYNERGIALQQKSANQVYYLDLIVSKEPTKAVLRWDKPPTHILAGYIVSMKSLIQSGDIGRLWAYAQDNYWYFCLVGGGELLPFALLAAGLLLSFLG